MKIHQCNKPYAVKTGRVPVRLSSGDILLENDNGQVFRLVRGELVEVDAGAFHEASFQTTDWETASQSPGKKKSVRRKAVEVDGE